MKQIIFYPRECEECGNITTVYVQTERDVRMLLKLHGIDYHPINRHYVYKDKFGTMIGVQVNDVDAHLNYNKEIEEFFDSVLGQR